MTADLGVVILFLVALALVVAVVGLAGAVLRSTARSASREPAAPDTGPLPTVTDFRAHGDEAEIHFDVPLPAGEVDEVLRGLLEHQAVEVVREKVRRGLPLGDVRRIRVFGHRAGEPVAVTVVELPSEGVLPETGPPRLLPHVATPGYDPLAHVGAPLPDTVPGVVERPSVEQLGTYREEIRLPAALEAGLRAQGVDPDRASLVDLVVGLLQLGGYVVRVDRGGPTGEGAGRTYRFVARRQGRDVLVVVVPHEPGSHPELSERDVQRFLVAVGEAAPDRALLVTDKYGPYVIYEKERRNPTVRFITRERLQAFVDGFAVGGGA